MSKAVPVRWSEIRAIASSTFLIITSHWLYDFHFISSLSITVLVGTAAIMPCRKRSCTFFLFRGSLADFVRMSRKTYAAESCGTQDVSLIASGFGVVARHELGAAEGCRIDREPWYSR